MKNENQTTNYPIDIDFVNRSKQDKEIENFIRLFGKQEKENPAQHRVKSVLTPSAQIAELFQFRNLQGINETVQRLLSNVNSGLSITEKAIIELQFLYGIRITEALRITPSDINSSGQIRIRGIKGSNDRIVYPVKFSYFWLSVKENNFFIPSSYNRFYFYRLYRKKGIYFLNESNKKESVTHALRYLYISSLIQQGLDQEQIRNLIGHKSIKSTIHYVDNLRKK